MPPFDKPIISFFLNILIYILCLDATRWVMTDLYSLEGLNLAESENRHCQCSQYLLILYCTA